MLKTNLLEEMSRVDIAEALKETQTVLIPVGAIEQHGPHLPLLTDVLPVEVVSIRAAEKLGALVAPTIKTGYSPFHMHVSPPNGTITLRPDTFINLMKDYAHCLARHGFKRIIFINGHGGNNNIIATTVVELIHELPNSQTIWMSWFAVPEEYRQPTLHGHAGAIETALILALRPELVRLDRAVKELPHTPEGMTDDMLPTYFASDFALYRKSGVMGDPKKYTREQLIEIGEKCLEAGVKKVVRTIEVFKDAHVFKEEK